MSRHIFHRFWILLLSLSFGVLVASAQTLPQIQDPEADQHALGLFQAAQAQNIEQYQQLFFSNPELTKRAFIQAWMVAESGNLAWMELQQMKQFIQGLAADIHGQLQDPKQVESR